MVRKISPELALAKVIGELREKIDHSLYEEILSAGSVPLGTYIEDPDLDIFIVTKSVKEIHDKLTKFYRWGKDKNGELTIYWVPSLFGYDTDFVIIHPDDHKVQTLNHVRYYRERMNDDFRANIVWLKRFFKEINCYGAETGGITGICITRLAEMFINSKISLGWLIQELLMKKEPFIEDPTLDGRNLFASVKNFKRGIMIQEIHKYLSGSPWELRDLHYFFNTYDRVYHISRNKKLGTDKEFQYVYSVMRKKWNELKNDTKWWNPFFTFDILVVPYDIYIGFTINPKELLGTITELIPLHKLNEKSRTSLLDRGAIYNADIDCLEYKRKKPFENLIAKYENILVQALVKQYPKISRA